MAMKTFTLADRKSVYDYINYVFETRDHDTCPVVVVKENIKSKHIEVYAKCFADKMQAKHFCDVAKTTAYVPTSVFQTSEAWESTPSIDWVN